MKIKFLSTILIGFLSVGLQAQVNIAYMNPNSILGQLEEVIAIDQQIEALINQRDQEIKIKANTLQQAFSEYDATHSSLTNEEQKAIEAELLKQNQELESERESYLNEIRQKRAQLLQPVIDRMNVAIDKIAKQMDIDIVLNEDTSYGDAIIFYSSEDRLNITKLVLAELKSE